MHIDTLTALVTGAAQGLGRCFTLELLKGGARVMAGDLHEDGLEALAREARGLPGTLVTAQLDVSHEATVKAFIGGAVQRLGPPNLLVNNAGILRDGLLVFRDPEGFVRKLPTSQWKQVIDTNLTGPYLMTRETVALMIEQAVRPGLVVNISSVTGAGNAGQSNYAASKAGLDADTRTWALELAPHGIRVAGIAPGLTDTPMAAALSPDKRSELVSHIPLGRMGEPVEIWAGLKFIIECDFFTGRVLSIDGGASYA
jgi:3-oxoacyl-[acyl-carrier protein] reductase